MILDELGKNDDIIEYDEKEYHNVRDKKADISKAKRDLDHTPKVPLKEGIKRTIEWQKKTYPSHYNYEDGIESIPKIPIKKGAKIIKNGF